MLQVPDLIAASDPLGPPYAACTKAAALGCLRHLASNKQGAKILAAQRGSTDNTSLQVIPSLTPKSTQEQTYEQHQQQSTEQPGNGSTGVSMLQHVLLDIQQLRSAATAAESSSAMSISQDTVGVPEVHTVQDLSAVLDDAAGFVLGLVEGLEQEQLLELPLVSTLQVNEMQAWLHVHGPARPRCPAIPTT